MAPRPSPSPLQSSLLPLTRAASDGRGTTRACRGIEVARVETEEAVCLAAGSTDSWEDLRRSLWCRPTPWGDRWAHSGYHHAALVLFATYRGLIGVRRVYLAGHSLGGAVVRQLAHLLTEDGCHVAWLETYGEPAGLRGESRPLPGRRYVCGRDPVPHWCPWYRHEEPATQLRSPWPLGGPWDHRLSSYERTRDWTTYETE